jgi:hypothetical protein
MCSVQPFDRGTGLMNRNSPSDDTTTCDAATDDSPLGSSVAPAGPDATTRAAIVTRVRRADAERRTPEAYESIEDVPGAVRTQG